MSKNIKIELELPEFEKEINITITLKKDGEVYSSLSSSETSCVKSEEITEAPIWKQEEPKKKKTKSSGSNCMDLSF